MTSSMQWAQDSPRFAAKYQVEEICVLLFFGLLGFLGHDLIWVLISLEIIFNKLRYKRKKIKLRY